MAFADITDGKLYYESHGEGFPLVFSTGMGGSSTYWAPQIEEFAKHFRVIVYDHRGTGRSTRSGMKYTVELMAQDLIDLMDSLGIAQADAVGHSTGGMLMQAALVDHPERFRRAVFYSTRANADHFTKLAMGMRLALLRTAGVAAYLRSTPIFLYPSDWIRDNAQLLKSAEDSLVESDFNADIMASRIEAVLNHDQTNRVHRIVAESLVLCAKDDFLTPPYYSRELAALIPGAKLAFINYGGHACSRTNPSEFNKSVLSFLTAGHE
jgi:aminoacrylate hydrolase